MKTSVNETIAFSEKRNLAVPEEILLSIEKPARYIGNEVNAASKDPKSVDVLFCMCFPDVYEIGMSHLGIQILYDMFNRREDVYCDRVYSPWPDMDKAMRVNNIRLFGVESQLPIKDFDFLGITLQYEMCYTNILQILDLSGIPINAKDRTEDDPIVVGGGPCSYNPEPLAPFFDFFYMGEGETRYYEIMDLYKEMRASKKSRAEILHAIAKVPGMYVPALYEVEYYDEEHPAPDPLLDGTIRSFEPIYDDIPKKIRKEIVKDMSDTYYPNHPIVPYIKATQDKVTLEIQRGCIRGCRFCQAGMIYRPVRERSLDFLKKNALELLTSTGHEEITLSSLSSSDYSHLEELVNYLIDTYKDQGVNISLPSLRIDAFSLDVMSKVQDIRKSSVTFAPEAGTQRLRNVINKGLTEEDIINGSGQAFDAGWTRVKLYFMLGLPTETVEDMEGIPILCNKIAARYYEIPKEKRNGRVQIVASSSFFVPKPFTPFQWVPMCTKEEFLNRARIVRHKFGEMLNSKSMKYNWHEADLTVLEGVLARGDRRIAPVIVKAYEKGCIFDAWSEYYKNDVWMEAFDECGVSIDFYNTRERSTDELLPWDFIDTGVSKRFLIREWEKAQRAEVTFNCRKQCSGCGVGSFEGGICVERKN